VAVSVNGVVARITVGDQRRRNALRRDDWSALEEAVRELADDHDVRVVTVRGTGGTFSAGSDIREWVGADADQVDGTFEVMQAALDAMETIAVPTVAVVEGVAAGAGCQLALSCDICVMARSALLGMPVLRLGILPSPAFALRLTALAGTARAREMLYTGRLVTADEAERYGLATMVANDSDIDDRAAELVAAIGDQPRTGLVAAKAATGIELDWLRNRHRAPGWRFSDPEELPARVAKFLRRSG
jgi:enoyl-CoA hydratase/carnithine racemase